MAALRQLAHSTIFLHDWIITNIQIQLSMWDKPASVFEFHSLDKYFQVAQFLISSVHPRKRVSEQSMSKRMGFHTNLFVCTDTRRAAEVKLVSFNGEFLTGPRIAVTIKAAAFAAVHRQLTNLAPRYKTSITTESVQTTLMVDLMLNLKPQRRAKLK